MSELNNLAKYNLSQIEGLLKQHRRIRSKYWILVIIFSTLMSALGAIAIIAVCLYAFKYPGDFALYYLSISTSSFFGLFLILFFIFLSLHHQQTIAVRKINNYLKEKKKK